MYTYNENIDFVKELCKEQIILIDKEQLTDIIIKNPKKNQKIYMRIKGSDTLPSNIDDIARFFYIKKENREYFKFIKFPKPTNDEYVIFDERGGNENTAKNAKKFKIKYFNKREYLEHYLLNL